MMNDYIIWFIALFGLLAMVGVFWRMQRGFGPLISEHSALF